MGLGKGLGFKGFTLLLDKKVIKRVLLLDKASFFLLRNEKERERERWQEGEGLGLCYYNCIYIWMWVQKDIYEI